MVVNRDAPARSACSKDCAWSDLAGLDMRVVRPQQTLSHAHRAVQPRTVSSDSSRFERAHSLGVVSNELALPVWTLADDDGVAGADVAPVFGQVVEVLADSDLVGPATRSSISENHSSRAE